MTDLIIVGAGSAGAVLADRLSADGRFMVMLIEAGGADDRREVRIPAAFSKMFRTEVDWALSTDAEPHLDHRELYWPRGKMLGGCSSLNAMMYVRGHRTDFDQWRQLGNPGWGYDDVLPYFKRSERFTGTGAAPDLHGVDGAHEVSDQRSPNVMTAAFIAAGVSIGLAHNPDVNGPVQDGIGYTHVSQHKGRRVSTADAFLGPARTRSNLRIETDCQVERVILDGGRAVGVSIRQNGATRTERAAKGVILAAGTIGSPHLLMLSGIGPATQLQSHGIPVHVERAAVGANLQDHLTVGVGYHCRQPVSLAGAESVANLARYLLLRRGPLTSNVGEGLAFVRTRDGLSAPDIELIFAPTFFQGHGAANPPGHGFSIAAILLRPESRGTISLAASDPLVAPRIRANYLSTAGDRTTLRAGVRLARRIAQSSPFDPYRGDENSPGAAVESDADLDAAIRQKCETLYHPVGTCRMGSDPEAVVDARLSVRGVDGLWVVDASVMPTIIGGHTHAPAMMIAEKAADLIMAR